MRFAARRAAVWTEVEDDQEAGRAADGRGPRGSERGKGEKRSDLEALAGRAASSAGVAGGARASGPARGEAGPWEGREGTGRRDSAQGRKRNFNAFSIFGKGNKAKAFLENS